MRRIAVEEAFITHEISAELKLTLAKPVVEPGLAMMGKGILSSGNVQLHRRLHDLGTERIVEMQAAGIDMQVLSITSPGVQVFEAQRGTELAAMANDQLADAVRKHPKHFAGLGCIAPQDPQAAAREIERIAGKLGLNGVIINSHSFGEYLDAAKFTPILEAAQATGMPIYLHPREPGPGMVTPYLDYGLYFAGWGFAAETSLHAMRLIMSGTFSKFPNLKIVLGHMGEGIPYWLQRIDNRFLLQVKIGELARMPLLPSEYFLQNFVITTSGVTSMPALRHCIDVLGVERIMFAADHPYEDQQEAVTFLDGATITAQERQQIYEDNAVRVFKLR